MVSYIKLGEKIIPLYGICCVIGLFVAVAVALWLAKKKGYEFFDFCLIIIITLICAFVGAKVLFLIVSWQSVRLIFETYEFAIALKSVITGGFVFYGGLIGGAIGLFVTLIIKKCNIIEYASIFVIALTIGHAFGRIGCFCSGCCYGIEYDGFLSFSYTNSLDNNTPIGVQLLPIQLIESFLLFVLFFILLICYIKLKNNFLVIMIYSVSYSLIRFILEFFRGDLERGSLLNLSTSQWISLIILLISIATIIIFICNKKHSVKHNS